VSTAKLLSPDVPQSHVEQSGYVIIGRLKDGNLNLLSFLNNNPSAVAAASQATPFAKNGNDNKNVAPKLNAEPTIAAEAAINS
jgi:hypothetical protein